MKPKLLLRITSFLMLFYAVSHTFSVLTVKKVTDEQALKTLDMMSAVFVPMFGKPSPSTYFNFFFGYGLSSTVTLLTLCALFWMLAGQAEEAPARVRNLLLPLLCAMIGYAVLDFVYFFPPPAIVCVLASVCIAVSAAQLSRK
jgi:hypothetical protein